MTALLAWPILGETLSPITCLGMAITIGGIAWVVSENPQNATKATAADTLFSPRLGLMLAFIGTISVSIGNALAKLGMLGTGRCVFYHSYLETLL